MTRIQCWKKETLKPDDELEFLSALLQFCWIIMIFRVTELYEETWNIYFNELDSGIMA